MSASSAFEQPLGSEALAALVAPLRLEGAWQPYDGGEEGQDLTDDLNPIDALQAESIAQAARRNRELESLRGASRP